MCVVKSTSFRIRTISPARASFICPAWHLRFIELSLFPQAAMVANSRFSLLQVHWPKEVLDCTHANHCWFADAVYITQCSKTARQSLCFSNLYLHIVHMLG